jgi:4'-phosphopantetheinyl transferase
MLLVTQEEPCKKNNLKIIVDPRLKFQIRFEDIRKPVWKKSYSYKLRPGDIAVWRFDLHSYTNNIQRFSRLLGSEEKARFARFHNVRDKQTFIAGRAILRLLLGMYVGINPRDITFIHSENTKPRLNNECNLSIHFNVSYSRQWMLIAVSDEEVGIDIEHYGDSAVTQTEMNSLFTEDEVIFINNQPKPVKAFHTLWTRKEALLKAISQGIIDEIKFVPCLNGTHLTDPTLINSYKNWVVYSFDADEFCTASIAFSGLNKKLTFNS